jgi:hypothetical protein
MDELDKACEAAARECNLELPVIANFIWRFKAIIKLHMEPLLAERVKAAEEAVARAILDQTSIDVRGEIGRVIAQFCTGALAHVEARAEARAFQRCSESAAKCASNDAGKLHQEFKIWAAEARKQGGLA